MDEVPAAGAPAAAPAAATIQGSPIVAHGSPQYNDENAGKCAERDRALEEIYAGIMKLSEFYATRDRVNREVDRMITRKSKSDDNAREINEDIRDLAKQRLADIDRKIEEERVRWQAEQKTAPVVTKGESQNCKDNKNGKEQS